MVRGLRFADGTEKGFSFQYRIDALCSAIRWIVAANGVTLVDNGK